MTKAVTGHRTPNMNFPQLKPLAIASQEGGPYIEPSRESYKVLRWCGFGFAAGCEAVAMPRRRGAFYIFGLCPWCDLWPNKSEGLSPDQGHSPGIIWLLSAGHSHRLTSGGKAEPDMAHDF